MSLVNAFDQIKAIGGTGFIISPAHGGIRETYVSGYSVIHLVNGVEEPTDSGAPWYHHKRKWFSNTRHPGKFHERQRLAEEEAKAWVAKTYGFAGPWKRNIAGDFVPEACPKIRRDKPNR